ncbi:MAG: DUF4139 domain-containing protein [Pseudomonadota bacterium]|nr:DUF4139 domain-containing protein [Pseudomonadota bacterium]
MHRPSTALIATVLLAACSPSPEPEEKVVVQTPVPVQGAAATGASEQPISGIGLTIYSGDYQALSQADAGSQGMPGYALVQRPLQYTLAAGTNAVTAAVPPTMDVEAAMLRAEREDVSVTGQRYTAALSGTSDVLAEAVGQRVAVEHTSGGARQTDSGTLISADDGLALALGDGRVKLIRDYDSFSIIDSGAMPPQQPSLRWSVEAASAGAAGFVLSYPMAGLAWRAEYLARLGKPDDSQGKGCRLSLDGAALVANRSGQTFSDARLTLVAGEPRRVRSRRPPNSRMNLADQMSVAAPAPAMPEQRASAEYRAYRLPQPVRIGDGAIERIPLFPRQPSVACERVYVVDAGSQPWQPPRPIIEPGFNGRTGDVPVSVEVLLNNAESAGLGQAMPEGRVRLFEGDEFLGESSIGHTAMGEEVRMEVGTAFELNAERDATAFSVDRSGRTVTEAFEITLRNAKDQDVVVRVIEPLPRWTDWEVTASNLPSKKVDARHVRFDVPVPAGDQARLTYTVQYRWPRGVSP